MSSTDKIMLTRLQEDEEKGGEKTWVYSYKNMKPYISRNGSKNILNCIMGCSLSPPWARQNKWIPMGSNNRPQMQCVNPRSRRWKRLNLFHNAKEKTSKGENMG
jgi:hypothetical protein